MLRATTRAAVHLPTVLGIGVVSFAAVTVLHEVGGHGVTCLLVGGEVLAVSSTELRCDGPEDAARLAVIAAGSVANNRGRAGRDGDRDRAGTSSWPLVVCAVVVRCHELVSCRCYMLIGPVTNFGDWAYVARDLQPELVWIIGITALGFGVNVVGTRLAARPVWQPLLGADVEQRKTRMQLLTRLPLAAALVVSLAAGLLSPLQPRYALLTSVVAPLVLVLLIFLPAWPNTDQPAPPIPIAANWVWVAAGIVVGLGFVLILGPGLGSFEGYPIAR